MPRILNALKQAQAERGWLAPEDLERLADELREPLYRLQGLASFYPHFRLSPPPRLRVQVCRDLSCHLGGAPSCQRAFEQAAAGQEGVVVEGVSCLGRCDQPTAVALGEQIVDAATPEAARSLLLTALAGESATLSPEPSQRWVIDPYGNGERQLALRRLLDELGPEGLIAELKSSGLRGMGGAGFPTGIKWESVRGCEATPRYLVCNADESEPGTFKDRELMATVPDLVLEGMLLGALTVGAEQGWIYLRHEYHREAQLLSQAIEDFRARGLLGEDVAGSGQRFEVELFVSPGGYICGEETALLEALEDKRAEPRNKPPFPAFEGLWGKPTLINNVETFAMLPAIALKGGEWFQRQGRGEHPGLKLLALSGHVERPGVYEVPLGLPLSELVERHGGGMLGCRALKAFAPGGASSGFLPAAEAEVELEFRSLQQRGSMLGSGAVVVVAEPTCMLDLALNVLRFFRDESCGKCVPCRAGSEKLVEILRRASQGEGVPEDLALVDELAETMQQTSICGLGQAAPLPVTSVLRHFRQEVDDHILGRRCPSGVCPLDGAGS